jgi:hypothetical protein
LLPGAARASPKTVDIVEAADSRAYSAAIDTAGIQAKFNLVVKTAGSCPKGAPGPIDAARRGSPGRAIVKSTSPGPRLGRDAASRIANACCNTVRPRAIMAGSDDERHMLAYRARSAADAGAGDAPAPRDDRGLGMGRGQNHKTANESRRQGQSRSTSHLLLRNIGWHSRFKTAI